MEVVSPLAQVRLVMVGANEAGDEAEAIPKPIPPSSYERGSLVWAKIHGFPWWPSQALMSQKSPLTAQHATSWAIRTADAMIQSFQVRSLRPLREEPPRVRVRFWYTKDDATLSLDKVRR
jgi:hypothetical protein